LLLLEVPLDARKGYVNSLTVGLIKKGMLRSLWEEEKGGGSVGLVAVRAPAATL